MSNCNAGKEGVTPDIMNSKKKKKKNTLEATAKAARFDYLKRLCALRNGKIFIRDDRLRYLLNVYNTES